MKRESLLTLAVVLVTVLVALGLIRWQAPGLLGIPVDLQVVQTSREVPPFFENVFPDNPQVGEDGYVIHDPLTRVRAPNLMQDFVVMGPNDVLGFRNRSVPNVADIITIGDSQTYGNNAPLEENWPSWMGESLGGKRPVVYDMSVGGWGAVQYLNMLRYAARFRPRVVVVAFYTGNDSLETVNLAYHTEAWSFLRGSDPLTPEDTPKVTFPAPREEWWSVKFTDGTETVFTPRLRFASNDVTYGAVRAGHGVMQEVARRLAEQAQKSGIRLVMTIIPTKELVYRKKIVQEGIVAGEDYNRLVEAETKNIATLGDAIRNLPGVRHVDVVEPLQEAALGATPLYPTDINGHPVSAGYRVIGRAVAQAVDEFLPERPRGPVAIKTGADGYALRLVNDEGVWIVNSPSILVANG